MQSQLAQQTESLGSRGELTFWEGVALTRWGQYLTEIEKRAVLKASCLDARRTTSLEIGCEGGRWSRLLAAQGWHVICTDIREDVLELCKRRIPSAKCVLVNRSDKTIPSESGAVDLLLCIEVGEIAHADWFIDEACRVLTCGGVLIGTILNSFSHRAMLHRLFRRMDQETRRSQGIYQVSYRKWKKGLLQRGFKLISEEGCCWFPFVRDSNSALIPYLVRLESYLGLRCLASVSPWIVFVARKELMS